MNIGIDVDGVILDSERTMDFYAEYYAYFELHKPRLRHDSAFAEQNFDFTRQEVDTFFERYFDEVTRTCAFLPGAKEIMKKLESEGHKLYVVTMRGFYNDREKEFCKLRLAELGVNFEDVSWGFSDKSKACKMFNLDVMIDDNPEHIKNIIKTSTTAIQFRDGRYGIPVVKSKKVLPANSWLEVYKIIEKLSGKSLK